MFARSRFLLLTRRWLPTLKLPVTSEITCHGPPALKTHDGDQFTNHAHGKDFLWSTAIVAFFGFFEKHDKDESELVKQIKLGVLAMQRDELDKAERLFHVALKTAQDLQEDDGITYVYDMLANVAFQKGDYKKSEKLFTEVLNRALHKKKLPEDHNAVIDISLKLAMCFQHQNDRKKAEIGYMYCLEKQEKKLEKRGMDVSNDTKLLWAKASNWYAHFLMEEESEEVNGNDDPQTLVVMNDLSAALHLLEKDEEAIELLRQAIAMGKKLSVPELATYYVNLGAIQLHQNLYHLAEQACRSGYNVAQKFQNSEAEKEALTCLENVRLLKESEGQDRKRA
ncbi:unnamed protein product [Notodromas monacha]|uniref:Tetratricopeptide repeat protein 19 n=1 Tax=Notodromas monacha TaxID=399045 RepID=A0A7R9BG74_9CRUS|nr:unnamed protein product [Notodromas monacha]CAG0914159.1 unnamed protein product [Notodromas monacha]